MMKINTYIVFKIVFIQWKTEIPLVLGYKSLESSEFLLLTRIRTE